MAKAKSPLPTETNYAYELISGRPDHLIASAKTLINLSQMWRSLARFLVTVFLLDVFFATVHVPTLSAATSGLLDIDNAVCAFDVKTRHIIAGPCAYQSNKMVGVAGTHFYVATHSALVLQYFIIIDYYPQIRSTMFWNLTPGNQDANLSLGDVDTTGGCWHNDEVNLCVWPGLQQKLDHKPDHNDLDIPELLDAPPRFAVDSACQFGIHPQQCVRNEQDAFEVLLEHWRDITIEIRKVCGEVGAELINENYSGMLSCVETEMRKMQMQNQGPFQYRRSW